MSGEGAYVIAGISLAGTILVAVLAFMTNRRANRTSEKHLSLEEQQAEDNRDDLVTKRQAAELDRLYARVDKLEETVKQLQQSDTAKQKTINDQADELERTNDVLSALRALFSKFVSRVEDAWTNQGPMPTLTTAERALLNAAPPTHRNRGDTQ